MSVYKSYSTGEVKLDTRDYRDEPVVDFELCSDRRDLDRMMDAYKRAIGGVPAFGLAGRD